MFQLTKYLDIISPLALLVFALFQGNIQLRRDYIFWFIVFQTLINGIATIYDKVLLKDNLFLYHINCALSFVVLVVYFLSISKIRKIKLFIHLTSIAFGLFFIVNLMLWENLLIFNSNSFSIASLIIVTYSLLYYLENLLSPETVNIAGSKHFWFVTGLLTYYASNFFIFVTYRYFTQNNIQATGILWQTHNVIFLMLCLYLLKGMLCKPLQEKYNL